MTVTCVVSYTINCRQGGGWRRRQRQSELTDFSGRIRGHELWAPTAARIRGHELSGRIRGHGLSVPMAARIRARELSCPNPRSRTFGASGADPSLRTEFSGGRPAGRIQVEKIFWWSAGGAHPSGKDFLGAGKTKWVTNSISKSDHMASDMCI